MKHGLSLYLTSCLKFLFRRTLKSRIDLILCTPNKQSLSRWCPEAPSNQHFHHCLIKDTAINYSQPCNFVTFDREMVTAAYCLTGVYSFQRKKSFLEEKLGQKLGNVKCSNRPILTQLLVSVYRP